MSDILIRGMEMPTYCIDCPFMVSRDNDDCILQSEEANETFESWEQMKAGCPLVPVPPHGRCIDADALEDNNITYYAIPVLANVTDAALVIKLKDIDNAPTIIPASKEGEV